MKSSRAVLGSLVVLGSLISLGLLAACNGAGSVPGVGSSSASQFFRPNQNGIRPDGALCKDYKLNLVNKTNQIEDKNVYFLLEGRNGGDPRTAKYIYLVDKNGDTAFAEHGKDIKNFNLAQTSEFRIPEIWAGRFYVSYNHPLALRVDENGRIVEPGAADKNDPNYNTPWDFIELNKRDCNDPSGNNFAPNLSQVDEFTIPMEFHVQGIPRPGWKDEETRGFKPGAYNEIKRLIEAAGPFSGLVLAGGSGRILSPVKGYDSNPKLHTYYDEYIKKVWSKYASGDKLHMTFNLCGETVARGLEGQVTNGKLEFTQTGLAPCKIDKIAFKMPSTRDVFFGLIQDDCVDRCTGGNQADVVSQIGAALNAAFYRSTLLKTTTISNRVGDPNAEGNPWPKSDLDYCEQKDAIFYDADTTSFFGKYVHEYAIDHLGYLSSVDEVCNQSSLVIFAVPGFKDRINQVPFTVTLVNR